MADLQQIASNNERAEALINSIEAEALQEGYVFIVI